MQAPRLCIACRSRQPVGGCEVSLLAAAGPRGRWAAARRFASKRTPSRPARAHRPTGPPRRASPKLPKLDVAGSTRSPALRKGRDSSRRSPSAPPSGPVAAAISQSPKYREDAHLSIETYGIRESTRQKVATAFATGRGHETRIDASGEVDGRGILSSSPSQAMLPPWCVTAAEAQTEIRETVSEGLHALTFPVRPYL